MSLARSIYTDPYTGERMHLCPRCHCLTWRETLCGDCEQFLDDVAALEQIEEEDGDDIALDPHPDAGANVARWIDNEILKEALRK